jgi:hypothetical protein
LVTNLNAKIKYLENNVEKGIAAYNDALSKNNKLKNEINELRKDKKSQREAYCVLEQKVEKLNSAIRTMDENIVSKRVNVDKVKESIMQIREKNETQNSEHANDVGQLKNSVCFNSNTMKESMVNRQNAAEAADTAPIVKLRIRNLMFANKEKIKIAEMYRKNMAKIEQSFEEIREESGISEL